MLQGWDKTNPGRVESIFTAMTNVKPSQLADRKLFDFESLGIDGEEQIDQKTDTDEIEVKWMSLASVEV